MNETALHLAVRMSKVEIVKFLLNNDKIVTNTKDSNNAPPIKYANQHEIQQLFKH